MKTNIRKLKLPQDYEFLAALLNQVLSEPTNVSILAQEDEKIPAQGQLGQDEDGRLIGYDRYRIVAVDEQDRPVAYGIAWRAPWTEKGCINTTLIVDEGLRGSGIGRAMYQELERWSLDVGADMMKAEVREGEPRSIGFATARGYTQERHLFESVLELASFDTNRLQQLIDHEIVIDTLASRAQQDNIETMLYELYKETSFDIPGFTGDYFDFKEWRKWTLDLPGSRPEYVLLAIAGDQLVGVAALLFNEESLSMYHEYTGVRKEWRGRGIAIALKTASIMLAKKAEAAYLRTNNDSDNKPMLAVNRDKLGFVAVPGYYRMSKLLSPSRNEV